MPTRIEHPIDGSISQGLICCLAAKILIRHHDRKPKAYTDGLARFQAACSYPIARNFGHPLQVAPSIFKLLFGIWLFLKARGLRKILMWVHDA
jgi:hypothetical protein